MKNAMKKMLSLVLAVLLLVSAVPFQASATTDVKDNPNQETATVTFKLKLDESNEVVDTWEQNFRITDPVMLVSMVKYHWSDYDFVRYSINSEVGTTEPVSITGDTTVFVRMTTKEEPKPEETPSSSVTFTLVVYEMAENAKEWASKSVTLSKGSATISELISEAGYTDAYSDIYASVNGRSFSGNAAIAISNGDQVDLVITPKTNSNSNNNTNKPGNAQKPSDNGNNNNSNNNNSNNNNNSKPNGNNNNSNTAETVTLKVYHNNGTSDYTTLTLKADDSILNAINNNKTLRNLSRDGYELTGWAFNMNSTSDKYVAAQHVASDAAPDYKIYADWSDEYDAEGYNKYGYDRDGFDRNGYDKDGYGRDGYNKDGYNRDGKKKTDNDEVYLKIYINGKTSSAAKVVNVSDYVNKSGQVTRSAALTVVKQYYTGADEYGMELDGLFDADTWEQYKASLGRRGYNKKGNTEFKGAEYIEVNEKGDTYIYVMVNNCKVVSSTTTSSSSSTADTSNPKTGDTTIYVAVTVMSLTAAALAAAYICSKKRAVK